MATQNDSEITRLKEAVAGTFGKTLDSPTDFDALALSIQGKTGEYISPTTLKRLFGYVKPATVPRTSTLSVLARYVGKAGWSDFSAQPVHQEPAEQPAQSEPSVPSAPVERKDVFGITFEQGRNEIKLNGDDLFANVPTRNKLFTPEAKRDLMIALITLKYTQSNSVCYVKDGQAIGIGAGQQSRIHCTRLAGNKADVWYLRQHPKVLNLPWVEKIRRADRDNTIDVYISDEHDDVLADGVWQQFFTEKPDVLTRSEKRAWLDTLHGVALGSDAFFPFGDNIERAHKSGVEYIAQAGGSVRDDHVIETCDKYGIAMAFTGIRLFHH